MLRVKKLEAGYRGSQVLCGVDFEVNQGEVVGLLGRNGMGKTTTMHSVMGMVRPTGGEITFQGRQILGLPPYVIARAGLGLVPENREIFPTLTVKENLIATEANRRGIDSPWTLDAVLDLFPVLAERLDALGSQLSGGGQQMLAIGRALMTNPALLLLDEATEGLAPLIRVQIWECLLQLKNRGCAMLVVDKNLEELMQITDRNYIIEKGAIAWSGTNQELRENADISSQFLSV
jgi:branched-chain amino acid transport system ATP-binding protein